jgi:hypothetical protein
MAQNAAPQAIEQFSCRLKIGESKYTQLSVKEKLHRTAIE